MLRNPEDVRLVSGTLSFVPMKSRLSTPDWVFSLPRVVASFCEHSSWLYLAMHSKMENFVESGTSGAASS